MKSPTRKIFSIFFSALVLTMSNVAGAQQAGKASRGSSSSAAKSQPTTCSTATKPGKILSKDGVLRGTLVREKCSNGCITGTLTIGGFTCKTLELPWRNNQQNISCIPADQTYVCQRVHSNKFGDTFEIKDVGNERKYILFHAGNSPKNTSGCVLLGMQIDEYNRIPGGESRPALDKFLQALVKYNSFYLTVTDKTGTCSSSSSASVARR